MRELDPLLHSQLRLAIVSLLLSVETADFVYLKEKTNATAGNRRVYPSEKGVCREKNSHFMSTNRHGKEGFGGLY